MSGLVIVGTGHAGLTLAREWRKLDADTPLTLITADDGAAYYKPNLSKSLTANKSADELVMAAPDKVAADYQATLRTQVRIRSIDPAAHTLFLDDGSELSYSQLVLANGASCRELPLEGDAVDAVLHVNNRLDYARFREQLPGGGHVLIIGAGLIGCEYANDLLASSHRVTLIDPLQHPLGTLLPEQPAQDLQAALEEAGARFHFGRTVTSVSRDDDGFTVRLDNGQELHTDLVLSAVGLVPNTAPAQAAGLDCGRGIRVNRMLQTSADNIYALGDVAEVCGHVLPYILPITQCARALAKTLAGEATPMSWPVMPVIVKTPVLPTIVCAPPRDAEGDWELEGEAPNRVARYKAQSGDTLGFVLTGTATKERGKLAAETQPLELS